jgi:hypothetical protein
VLPATLLLLLLQLQGTRSQPWPLENRPVEDVCVSIYSRTLMLLLLVLVVVMLLLELSLCRQPQGDQGICCTLIVQHCVFHVQSPGLYSCCSWASCCSMCCWCRCTLLLAQG